MKTNGHIAQETRTSGHAEQVPSFEVLTAEELAERWKVPVSWVRTQCQTRCADPIPHVRLGRYVRFQWNAPALLAWWARRPGQNIMRRSSH